MTALTLSLPSQKLLIWCVLVFSSLGIGGCASRSSTVLHNENDGIVISSQRPLTIKVDTKSNASFSAQVDRDNLVPEAGNQILYPGDTVGVFLASVAIHAMAVESSKNSVRKNQQDKANKILASYSEYLSEIEQGEVLDAVLLKLNGSGKYSFPIFSYKPDSASKSWNVHIKPFYIMAQDQRALMLRAEVFLERSESPGQYEYQNVIDIVSADVLNEDPVKYWVDEDHLRKTAEALFYSSIVWMINDLQTGNDEAHMGQKTFKYSFGGKKHYDRGYLLSQNCEQMVIRNLRGWIRVLPFTSIDECVAAADEDLENPIKIDIVKPLQVFDEEADRE